MPLTAPDGGPQPRARSRRAALLRRWGPLILVLVVGVASSILACRLIFDLEQGQTKTAFEQAAGDRVEQLRRSVNNTLLDMRSLHSLFTSSDYVTREEFLTFASPIITDEPAVAATLWAPRVLGENRAAFEAQAESDGLIGYGIRESTDDGTLATSPDRAEYYPIYYVYPEQTLDEILGWDLGSDPTRGDALRRAVGTARLTATAPLDIMGDSDDSYGYAVYQPVYGRLRGGTVAAFSPENISGFVGSLVNVGRLMESAAAGMSPTTVDITIYDTTSAGVDVPLWYHPGDGEEASPEVPVLPDHALRIEYSVGFADRTWSVIAAPSASFLAEHRPWVNYLVLSLGLAGTGLFMLYALLLQNRASQARRHAREMQAVLTRLRAEMEHRSQIEEQLLQSQKMEAVGQLAGGVAHDFNNLLTAILGNAEWLLARGSSVAGQTDRRISEEDDGTAELTEIKKAAELAAALTQKLLAFSRQQPRQPKTVRLDEEVWGMKDLLDRVLGDHIDLSVSGPATTSPNDPGLTPTVEIDPAQLHQVVMNLVINASDAMPQGGRIEVSVSMVDLDDSEAGRDIDVPPGRYALLQVSDTGHGMDEETLAHVFEPFFTTKDHGRGTGLGLAMVYGIVKQSAGHVDVLTALGEGTTFTVYLPIVPDTTAAPDSELSAGKGATREASHTILVVEDNDAVRNLAARILRNEGHTVFDAAAAVQAIDLVESGAVRPDILLTDVMMPNMNGPELAGRLTGMVSGLRVVFMSGYARDVMPAALSTDGPAFIQKPFTAETLIERMRETLDARTDEDGEIRQA